MSTLASHALPLLIGFLVKSTLLLLTAWALCLFLRRASAATRHLIWAVTMGGVLLLPILSSALPHWDIRWPYPTAFVSRPPARPQTFAPVASDQRVQTARTAHPSVLRKFRMFHLTPSGLAMFGAAVWLAGCFTVFTQLVVGLARIESARRRAKDLEGTTLLLAETAARSLGVRRDVQACRATATNDIVVPVTWGLTRCVILLPEHSVSWSQDCLRAALLHELAHVRRLDWLIQILARTACALFWFHPLVWLTAGRMRDESENACDDLVIRTGLPAPDYAQRFVDMVRSIPQGAQAGTVAIAMARPREVERRLATILAPGKDRSPVHRRRLVVLTATLGALLLPLATLRITPAQAAGDPFLSHTKSTNDPDAFKRAGQAVNLPRPPLRRQTMKPTLHALALAALAATPLAAHAKQQTVLKEPVKTVSIGTPVQNLHRLPAKTQTVGARTSNTAQPETIVVATTVTCTDTSGKTTLSAAPTVTVFSGSPATLTIASQGEELKLEVFATVAADKTITVETKIEEKTPSATTPTLYRPRLTTLSGQKAEVTISGAQGSLHFGVTPTLQRSR